jgi:hypothetical protein
LDSPHLSSGVTCVPWHALWHHGCMPPPPLCVADLFLRDRVRRAYARLPTLAPRLPFIGALLPPPPPPPIFVPGIGLLPAEQAVELLAPALIQGEEVYLASLTELAAGLLGEYDGTHA